MRGSTAVAGDVPRRGELDPRIRPFALVTPRLVLPLAAPLAFVVLLGPRESSGVIDEHQHTWRRTAALALVGSIPFLILVAWHWRIGPLAIFGDWAQYMLHAEALRHGRPYADIGYIFTPRNPFIGPPVQPPGLPMFLVPLLALTNDARDAALYRVFTVGCVLVFLTAVAAYLSRHGTRPLAVATVLIVGLGVEAAYTTNTVLTDPGFVAFVWLMFCLVDQPGQWGWSRVVAVTLLGFAALSFRLAGLPLVPALALYAILHRRELGARPFVPVIVWGAAGLAAAARAPGALTFARLVPRDPSVLIGTVVEALKAYPFAALDLFLYPFPGNHANDVYHAVIALLTVLGAIVWLRGMWSRFSIIFAAAYVGMLLVLPFQDRRYLLPIAPLALYAAAVGIATAIAATARLTRRTISIGRAQTATVGIVVVLVALTIVHEVAQPKPLAMMDVPGVRPLFARLHAARDTTPVRAVFINPRVLTWETGVPAMGFFVASPDTTLAELRVRRITHVVVGDVDIDAMRARSIAEAVAARPAAFRRLYSEGPFTVYAFDSTRAHP